LNLQKELSRLTKMEAETQDANSDLLEMARAADIASTIIEIGNRFEPAACGA
jgi:hypothetical protein